MYPKWRRMMDQMHWIDPLDLHLALLVENRPNETPQKQRHCPNMQGIRELWFLQDIQPTRTKH